MNELVAFEDAQARAFAALPLPDVETIALEHARGRVLARTVRAGEDLVPFARSAMDGYAVRAGDACRGRLLPVRGSIVAGDPVAALEPRTALAIATGAALPRGADAVIPWEDADLEPGAIRAHVDARPGQHLFQPGDDARRGDVLAAAGEEAGPGVLALLAAAGHAAVDVYRRPRAAVLCTGDELVGTRERARFGQIRESNGIWLTAALAEAGAGISVGAVRCGDDPVAVREAIAAAARHADLLVTTGGASSGPRDCVKGALDALGARFLFRSVALRPAKPAAVARLGSAMVVMLPGNPSAAFVGYHAFARGIVDRLAGRRRVAPRLHARLAGSVRAKSERTYAVLVQVSAEAGGLQAAVLPNQCSSLVGNAARANGIVYLPPGDRTYRDGEAVEIDLLGPVCAAERPAAAAV